MRRSGFFPRLALVGLARNGRYYGPYLLSCGAVAGFYYILRFLTWNQGLTAVRGAMYLQSMMAIGCFVVTLFAAVILLYANNFVMKRRQRELGLYNILGLEKRHIARVMLWETLFCAAAAILGGIAGGILLSKLILLLLLKLARMPVLFGFEVSWRAAGETARLFALLFLLTLAVDLVRLGRSRPIDLLHSAAAGEREPKTKRLLALLGALSLGGGYAIALLTKDPVQAMLYFFIAVGLVMIGTYCLFTAGSVVILKRLRANERFYYQTRHFTAVSGLLYRMKQNAVGLANICILSTMVLVSVSTTIALDLGLEDSLDRMFPYDAEFLLDLENDPRDPMDYLDQVREEARALGIGGELRYYSRYWCYCGVRGGEISLAPGQESVRTDVEVVSAQDYGRLTGREISLAPDEALAYVQGLEDLPQEVAIVARAGEAGLTFRIRERLTYYLPHGSTTLLTANDPLLFLVVPDQAAAERFADLDGSRSARQLRIQMEMEGTEEEKLARTETLAERLGRSGDAVRFLSKQDSAQDFYAMYGGFLFLGIFLGLVFLLATVLIIYYKQISEGYEDQRRYQILSQVGMTGREISASIHSQILLVFFLPLGAAGLHILAAFPMLSKMLELFNLYDIRLFALCTAGTLAVFCLIYALVYALTARTYGRIVGGPVQR